MTADKEFLKALAVLRRTLDKTGVPWMFIGGIAVVAHGIPRLTQDIDATLWGPAITLEKLLQALTKAHIIPMDADALETARRIHVLHARHAPTGVPLDIASRSFRSSAKRSNARPRSISKACRSASPFQKTSSSSRPRHGAIETATTSSASSPIHGRPINTERVLNLVRQIGDALDDPERVTVLERMIREAM